MAELKALTPCGDISPLKIGAAQLAEIDTGHLTSLKPLKDKARLSEALEAAHGVAFPAVGRSTGKDGARTVWFGRGEALLIGPAPDASLAKHAAVVDQSDGWCVVTLSGDAAVDVLARLVPVDLRVGQFKRGHTVRTQLGHMSASITRTGTNTLMILVFRSMAATLVHEIQQAMEAVASRG